MKLYIIIALLLTKGFANAQNENLLDSLIYDELLKYEMVFWSASTDSSRFIALEKKSDLYYNHSNYRFAMKEIRRASSYAKKSEHLLRTKYKKMLLSFLLNQYADAADVSLSTEELSLLEKGKEYNLIKLSALNQEKRWTECKKLLQEYVHPSDSVLQKEINQLPEEYNYRSPLIAERMSHLLPGLGQWYAGAPLKGVTSFIINAGLITFITFNLYTGFYITAIVSGLFPELKFYNGGVRYSGILAEDKNIHSINALQQKYENTIRKVIIGSLSK